MNPPTHRSRQYLVAPVPGAAPTIGRWLWALADGRQRTLQRLEALAPPVVDWPAPEGSNTIGTVLAHLAAIEMDWLYGEVLEQPLPASVLALLPPDVRDAAGRLAATRAILVDIYRPMRVTEFRRARQLAAYTVTPEWTLHHLLQHEAEHRGELGMLRARAEAALGLAADTDRSRLR